MTATRIYLVKDKTTGTERLVEAYNQAHALRFVAQNTFDISVADQQSLVRLVEVGQKPERAIADKEEPPAEQDAVLPNCDILNGAPGVVA